MKQRRLSVAFALKYALFTFVVMFLIGLLGPAGFILAILVGIFSILILS